MNFQLKVKANSVVDFGVRMIVTNEISGLLRKESLNWEVTCAGDTFFKKIQKLNGKI